MPIIYPLRGAVQSYAWGGTDYIPDLLGRTNAERKPHAELWFGTHAKGVTEVKVDGTWLPLADFVQQQPERIWGAASAAKQPAELAFLFKVLDVAQMLSIQAHPDRETARRGFEREEAAGIPRLAPQRTYRDANHKPEVMVALTEFWLLHGFRQLEAIENTLREVPGWHVLEPIFLQQGLSGLYRHVMTAVQTEINSLLAPLYLQLEQRQDQLTDPHEPDYWAWRAFAQYTKNGEHDRGLFSLYWLNLVHLMPGQAIFQAANVPHAYLRGVNVELMANSDNVFRGGLTQKHIAVDELLAHLSFDSVDPVIIEGVSEGSVIHYPVPVNDFALECLQLAPAESGILAATEEPAIVLVLQGEVVTDEQDRVRRGDSFLMPAGTTLQLTGKRDAVLCKASAAT